MLVDTPLDFFGQALVALMVVALLRAIWVDVRLTAIVRATIPDTYSKDPRKWAYLRRYRFEPEIWTAYLELHLLSVFWFAALTFITLEYYPVQRQRGFGYLTAAVGAVGVLALLKLVFEKGRQTSG